MEKCCQIHVSLIYQTRQTKKLARKQLAVIIQKPHCDSLVFSIFSQRFQRLTANISSLVTYHHRNTCIRRLVKRLVESNGCHFRSDLAHVKIFINFEHTFLYGCHWKLQQKTKFVGCKVEVRSIFFFFFKHHKHIYTQSVNYYFFITCFLRQKSGQIGDNFLYKWVKMILVRICAKTELN